MDQGGNVKVFFQEMRFKSAKLFTMAQSLGNCGDGALHIYYIIMGGIYYLH